MRRRWFALLLLATLPEVIGRAQLRQSPENLLFDEATAVRRNVPERIGTLRERLVVPRFDIFERAPAVDLTNRRDTRITVNAFDDLNVTAVLDRLEFRSETSFTWTGVTEGTDPGRVTLSVEGNVMYGELRLQTALYEISYTADVSVHTVREVNAATLGRCARPAQTALNWNIEPRPQIATRDDDGSTIDVLVVYTAQARSVAGGTSSILAMINAAVDNANTSYMNSGVVQRLRLVTALEIAYSESGDGDRDFERLENGNDSVMDEVQTLRDEYAADFVELVIHRGWRAGGGACVPNVECIQGLAGITTSTFGLLTKRAYSVASVDSISLDLALAHEVGHNMGLDHDDENSGGVYHWGRGYSSAVGRFRTVMAVYSTIPRVMHFSNPNVNFNGLATGIPDERDAARALNDIRTTTGNFRQSVSATAALFPNLIELNRDRRGDVFRYDRSTGAWARETESGSSGFTSSGGSWSAGWLVRAADWNRDGYTDFVLYDIASGVFVQVWNDTVGGFTYFVGRFDPGWSPYVVDLDGNGRSDLFLYNSGNGVWARCTSVGDVAAGLDCTTGSWLSGWRIYPLDLNGDGKTDLFRYNPSSGDWSRMRNTGSAFTEEATGFWSPIWDSISIGDFNADGRPDLFLYDSAGGTWFIVINTGSDFNYQSGRFDPGWTVRTWDLDGDGDTDVFVYNPATGSWVECFNARILGTTIFTYASGTWSPGWQVYGTDFNGDRRADMLAYNSTTGTYVKLVNTGRGAFDSSSGSWSAGQTIIANRRDVDDSQSVTSSCTFTISPTSRSHGAGAENGSVSVTAGAGCSWTAATTASWITVTGGASGSGNGTANYSVAANSSSSDRTGTLTIAGKAFTVSQQGAQTTVCQLTATVSSQQAWQSSGCSVNSGDQIIFSASGTIRFDSAGATATPDGSGRGSASASSSGTCNYPLCGSSIPQHSLVGRVGSSSLTDFTTGFFIGSSRTVTATANGSLYLGFNDGFVRPDRSGLDSGGVGDNSGSFSVSITVRR